MTAYLNLAQDYQTNSPFTAELFGKATLGLDGEVATQTARGATIVKVDATGRYRIVLDPRAPLPDILFAQVLASHGSNHYFVWVTEIDPVGAKVSFRLFSGATPVATLPASGTQILYRVAVQNG